MSARGSSADPRSRAASRSALCTAAFTSSERNRRFLDSRRSARYSESEGTAAPATPTSATLTRANRSQGGGWKLKLDSTPPPPETGVPFFGGTVELLCAVELVGEPTPVEKTLPPPARWSRAMATMIASSSESAPTMYRVSNPGPFGLRSAKYAIGRMIARPNPKIAAEMAHGGRRSSVVGPTGGGGPAVRAEASRLTAAPTASAQRRSTSRRTEGRGRRLRCAIAPSPSAGPRLTPSGGGRRVGFGFADRSGTQQVESTAFVLDPHDDEIVDRVPQVGRGAEGVAGGVTPSSERGRLVLAHEREVERDLEMG